MSITKPIVVSDGGAFTLNAVLQKIQYGNVSGKVTDAYTGNPIGGATVSCSSGASAVTTTDGSYLLSNVVVGTYTSTVTKTGYTAKTQACTVVANTTMANDFALAPVSFNVAQGKTFTASKTSGTTNVAGKAGDGNTSTYWDSGSLSSSTANQWLSVDLGKAFPVNKVVVDWYSSSYYARGFQIQTSADGVTWTTQYTATYGSSNNQTVTFATVSARYVRLNCTSYYSSSGYRVAELQAWTP